MRSGLRVFGAVILLREVVLLGGFCEFFDLLVSLLMELCYLFLSGVI